MCLVMGSDGLWALAGHHLEHDPALQEHKDVLPPPVAADLNGDGRVEVITAMHDARLHVRSALVTSQYTQQSGSSPE
jgi:hypothetical protein